MDGVYPAAHLQPSMHARSNPPQVPQMDYERYISLLATDLCRDQSPRGLLACRCVHSDCEMRCGSIPELWIGFGRCSERASGARVTHLVAGILGAIITTSVSCGLCNTPDPGCLLTNSLC